MLVSFKEKLKLRCCLDVLMQVDVTTILSPEKY